MNNDGLIEKAILSNLFTRRIVFIMIYSLGLTSFVDAHSLLCSIKKI